MSDIVKEVTPSTRGIIWLAKDETDSTNPHYKEIDYLLDGLLTANLQVSQNVSSRVIVGKNFNDSLYVLIMNELKTQELESYLTLLKDLAPENKILLIDEQNQYENLKSKFSKVSSHLQIVH